LLLRRPRTTPFVVLVEGVEEEGEACCCCCCCYCTAACKPRQARGLISAPRLGATTPHQRRVGRIPSCHWLHGQPVVCRSSVHHTPFCGDPKPASTSLFLFSHFHSRLFGLGPLPAGRLLPVFSVAEKEGDEAEKNKKRKKRERPWVGERNGKKQSKKRQGGPGEIPPSFYCIVLDQTQAAHFGNQTAPRAGLVERQGKGYYPTWLLLHGCSGSGGGRRRRRSRRGADV
jgi:hypothetical protein